MSETKNLKLFKHEEPLETNNNKFDIDKALNKNWDKVDDYAGEANSKIDLITEIIDLLPKVSNEGESITLENTARAKFTKFRIEGNSRQETTQGYNLYNIDEALNDVLKKNDDSSYTFTRTSSRFAKAVNISIPANTDFVIDYSNVKLNGNYEGNILSAVIKYTDDTDTTSSLYSTEEDKRGLRRYSKDIKSIQLYLESSLTEGTSITFSDFMIYLGSSLSKTYEPYTGGIPSPNPDYKSEIKNVKGNTNIKITDKNNEEQQEILFPLVQGQKLMQGDYLVDDGIHHKRKQVVLDGSDDEGWNYNGGNLSNNISAFTANISNLISVENTDTKVRVMCNKTIGLSASEATKLQKYNAIAVISDKRIYLCVQRSSFSTSPSTLKTWLQSNPITVEYELAEEEIETYTEVQKEAYEQIKNAISYKGQTNIFSTNEIKPIFEVEALADIGLLLNNMQAQILAGGE